MDISACDGSHYKNVFEVLYASIKNPLYQKDIDKTFAQLKEKIYLYSTDYKYKTHIKLRDRDDYVLLSGSTLTVITNNTANVGIAMKFGELLENRGDCTMQQAEDLLSEAATLMGYIVKCKAIGNDFEKLTFLKHSCTKDGRLFLGLGVLIRNFGRFVGDLPGRGDLRKRARVFNSDVVKSYIHAGNHIITEAFRSKIISETMVTKNHRYLESTKEKGVSDDYIETFELCKRYDCSVSELEVLAQCIRTADVGQVIKLPIIDKIMKVDYGY